MDERALEACLRGYGRHGGVADAGTNVVVRRGAIAAIGAHAAVPEGAEIVAGADGDPTRDIGSTRAIVGVWKAGRRFDHARYLGRQP